MKNENHNIEFYIDKNYLILNDLSINSNTISRKKVLNRKKKLIN